MGFFFSGSTSTTSASIKPLRKEIDFTRAHIEGWREALKGMGSSGSGKKQLDELLKALESLRSKVSGDSSALDVVKNAEKITRSLKEGQEDPSDVVARMDEVLRRWDEYGLGKHIAKYYS